jgi:hypothetical protein
MNQVPYVIAGNGDVYKKYPIGPLGEFNNWYQLFEEWVVMPGGTDDLLSKQYFAALVKQDRKYRQGS